ncbi:MAG TPA: response regulator, partial [Thermoanaerobaculia bacterium]|nr:response regulator [Thermoanaerobaculia bacterium]
RLASAAEPHTGLAAPGGRLRPSRPLSVVIVEDDLDSAESLALLLQLLGHKVAVGHTGEGGIAAVRATRPDVVLCDIGLPDLDGFAVARALRGDPSTAGVPLVAITGYGEEDARRQAVEAGFEHHLVKPVDPDRLFELLAEYAARAAPMPSTVAPAAESD